MKTIDRYHKWVEWSEEDQVYVGKCPDLIKGIHGQDPVLLFDDLCSTVQEVIDHFRDSGRDLPQSKVRPMMDVA